MADFQGEIQGIFNTGEFLPVPPEDLVDAMNDKSALGVAVESAPPGLLEFHIFFRGFREVDKEYYKFYFFKRTMRMKVCGTHTHTRGRAGAGRCRSHCGGAFRRNKSAPKLYCCCRAGPASRTQPQGRPG